MLGNLIHGLVCERTISFEEVSANTTEYLTADLPGARVGDFVMVEKSTNQAGLSITGAKVTASDVVSVRFANNTGSGITPTAGDTYRFLVFRPETPVRNNALN